jgi:putative methionine-R-sulfoxide reductase with GAF domain
VLSGLYALQHPGTAPRIVALLVGSLVLLFGLRYLLRRIDKTLWFPRLGVLIGLIGVTGLALLSGGSESHLWPAFLLVAAGAAPAFTRSQTYALYSATTLAIALVHALSAPTWNAYQVVVVIAQVSIVLALTELYRHLWLQTEQHHTDLTRAVKREEQAAKSLSRRNIELNLLNNVALTLNSTLELDSVLTRVIELTNASLGIDIGSVSLLDEKSGELVIRTLVGQEALNVDGTHIPKGQGIAGWVYEHGRTAMVHDVQSDPRFYPGIDQLTGFTTRNILCIPLCSRDRVLGVIEAINKAHGAFTDEDQQLLEGLSAIAAPAIENASLHTRLKEVNDALRARYNELQQTQSQLVAAEKRAATMELAGAAAHQLNQPLTVVLCSLGLVRRSLPPDHEALEDLEVIEQAVEKATEIVKKIGSITDYKTKTYVEGIQILDLDSTGDESSEE